MSKIAIIQPEVPHYREEFFHQLRMKVGELDLYVYNSIDKAIESGFNVKADAIKYLDNKLIKGLLWYSLKTIFKKKYSTLVLMLHFAHLTTWFLLLTKWIHRKKIILWGQGISVKRYLTEEKKPDWKLKLMIRLSDGVWLYTQKEYEQWHKIFPNKNIVALNNTLTGVDEMLSYKMHSKQQLKEKYNIKEQILFVFCARFESNYRRTDLLLDIIKRLDSNKYGFIIIGAGKNKPDFSAYKNVYDYGALYDTNIKRELFSISDIYIQPGWVGLSIVEAMAYGKPIFTFRRSIETLQCVEYSYIEDGKNGKIFDNIDDFFKFEESLDINEINILGNNARQFVSDNLRMEQMVERAISIL